jgi:hypothetical protein
MTKRERIYNKFDGRCAYTGKPLDDTWQIDYIMPQLLWYIHCVPPEVKIKDDIGNFLPCLRIVNHYKRARTLNEFRDFMIKFPERYAKLPKKTRVPATQKRKEYLEKVKEAFDDSPIWTEGKFWFEVQK